MAADLEILIVEDSDTQALQLQYLLEQEGWRVSRAAAAESALEQIDRRPPSLIVTGYHLPGMRGDELCRRIRMNPETRGIPILMLTVGEVPEPMDPDSGADDCLSKSASPDVLLSRVRGLLSGAGTRAAMPRSRQTNSPPARLLAIDDSPTYLEALSESLLSEGYEVTKARCGEEGLDRISRSSFDCVIVDLVMPDLDGIEVCRRIQRTAQKDDNSIAVIMLTSCESEDDMTRGLEAGADDFVGKSSDMTVLRARIRALLRRKFFQEENRRIREELLRKVMEAAESRAARELSETRAELIDELERKNRELEAFSYSVSHDLRAPLRSIDGFSTALLEDYGDTLDAKAREHLDRVRAAAQRMGELIDDLLQLSRVSRTDLERTDADLSALAASVLEELQLSAPERSVTAHVASGMRAQADSRLMRVVFENLLGNAWKFTTRTAEPLIELGVSNGGDRPTYFVRDNGAGFDMAHAARLFTPFQRLHSTEQFPGTGIGLATVQRIIERHGGRVWAEGTAGQGATFFWTLPAARNGVQA